MSTVGVGFRESCLVAIFMRLLMFVSKMLYSWIVENLDGCENPRILGKPLVENRKDQWRYRVGDYRIIVIIDDDVVTVHLMEVGQKKCVSRKECKSDDK